jgi:hypothetical protein
MLVTVLLAGMFGVHSVQAGSVDFGWARGMGGINLDAGLSIAIGASGNVYTTGAFSDTVDFDPGTGVYNLTSAGGYDIFVSKLDVNGDFVWAKRMGGSGTSYDSGEAIKMDPFMGRRKVLSRLPSI